MSPVGSVGRSVRGRRLPDAIPDSGADQEWLVNHGEGSTLDDTGEASALEGDIVGATWESSGGVDGYHLDFDGIDDVVRVDNSESQMHGDDGFTISVWINPDEWIPGANIAVKSEGGSTNPNDWGLFYLDGDEIGENEGIRLRVGADGGHEEDSTVPDTNEWSNVIGTWDGGSESEIYLNGSFDASDTADTPNDDDLFSWGAPYDRSRRLFEGQISVVHYWDEGKDSSFISDYYDDWKTFFE